MRPWSNKNVQETGKNKVKAIQFRTTQTRPKGPRPGSQGKRSQGGGSPKPYIVGSKEAANSKSYLHTSYFVQGEVERKEARRVVVKFLGQSLDVEGRR